MDSWIVLYLLIMSDCALTYVCSATTMQAFASDSFMAPCSLMMASCSPKDVFIDWIWESNLVHSSISVVFAVAANVSSTWCAFLLWSSGKLAESNLMCGWCFQALHLGDGASCLGIMIKASSLYFLVRPAAYFSIFMDLKWLIRAMLYPGMAKWSWIPLVVRFLVKQSNAFSASVSLVLVVTRM